VPAGEPAPDVLDWDVILRLFNEWYGRYPAADAKATYRERTAAFDAMSRDYETLKASLGPRTGEVLATRFATYLAKGEGTREEASKAMGEVLLFILFPGLGKASDLRDRAVMRLDLTRTALALAAYKAAKGQYPAALAELSPAYMKEVPKDLFTDGPLVYKKTAKGYLLYSLGPNLKDDDGKTVEEGANEFDIAVKVE